MVDTRWSYQYESSLVEYLCAHHTRDIIDMLLLPDDTIHYSIHIDFMHLLDREIFIAHELIVQPAEILHVCDQALVSAQLKLQQQQHKHIVKYLCHVRITNLPKSQVYKENVSSIRCEDAARFIAVVGTVVRTGPVKMLEFEREYQCEQCKYRFNVQAQLDLENTFEMPESCPSGSGGEQKSKCRSRSFSYVEGSRVCRDFQEIKIQERIQNLDMGSIPRSIRGILQNDLVDSIQPGDDVLITGTLQYQWGKRKYKAGETCNLDLFIDINSIKSQKENSAAFQASSSTALDEENYKEFTKFWQQNSLHPLKARNHVVQSVCPQLCGLLIPKLAVLLCVLGGVAVDLQGSRIRGESHLLFVGDPGTGKSQLLKFAASLSDRSVITTGIGSTRAGLTVSAVKESGGEWALEAGALVLADGGICCIDEFSSIRKQDRTAIHEAMEQQTISVAKAGMVCSLRTRASIIAALNPKGTYDPDADLSVNCAIASPLLSRFDLIMLLLDSKNENWDAKVCDHIFNSAPQLKGLQQSLFSFEKLKSYVRILKSKFRPRITNFSKAILSRYYQLQRKLDQRNAARTTIRLLESLLRVSQAHAKLMFRDVVLPLDALNAIVLFEYSLQTSSIFGSQSLLHQDFHESPDSKFEEMQSIILKKLDLGDIPDNELHYNYGSESDNDLICSQVDEILVEHGKENENHMNASSLVSVPSENSSAKDSSLIVKKSDSASKWNAFKTSKSYSDDESDQENDAALGPSNRFVQSQVKLSQTQRTQEPPRFKTTNIKPNLHESARKGSIYEKPKISTATSQRKLNSNSQLEKEFNASRSQKNSEPSSNRANLVKQVVSTLEQDEFLDFDLDIENPNTTAPKPQQDRFEDLWDESFDSIDLDVFSQSQPRNSSHSISKRFII